MHRSAPTTMILHLLLLLSTFALAAPRPYVNTDIVSPATPLDKRQSSSYWMETIQRQGLPAYGTDKSYKVFRNVKEYGAVGDGNADDTAAIQKAIDDGNRCGGVDATGKASNCDSSTVTPAIVYFPAGTYKVSKSILMSYMTTMIGDGTNPPRIQGSADFDTSGLAMLAANLYIPGADGAEWFTNQNNFYRQIRNLIIDMTQMPEQGPGGGNVNGVHWQVAQACSMQNVVFDMKPKSDTNRQQGIFMENGSGMFMSDITFNGGMIGAYLGSQQFATRNLTFNECKLAIGLQWDWLWTFKSLNINNCDVGLNMSSTAQANETVGSAIVMDSKISASTAAIITSWSDNVFPQTGSTLLIHNTDFAGSPVAVQQLYTDATILAGNVKVAAWGQGNAYIPSGSTLASTQQGNSTSGSTSQGNSTSASKRAAEPINLRAADVADAEETCSDMEPVTSTVFVPANVVSTAIVSPLPGSGSVTGSATSAARTPLASSDFPPHSGSSTSSASPSASSFANATIASVQCSASPVIPTKSRVSQQAMNAAPIPSSLLQSDGSVYERSKPQYIDVPASSFISVKSFGATGDGTTDDSDALQKAMTSVTTDQILYFDHGAYVITKTIEVPANIRIVGEIWPMIMVSGTFFSDPSNPKPAFQVGKPGDSGNVEISDMIFETKGAVPGAIMMEWNVQQTSQGSVGMWDTHFRVGGSLGTDLQKTTCGAQTSTSFRAECAAAFLILHVTQTASAYLENVWLWVADHDLDLRPFVSKEPIDSQISLFNGRGMLVESQGPTWLWGTASEHSVLYNYQFSNAKNVFAASIQTETAYMQPTPDSLNSGFTPNAAFNDPDFADCTTENCKMTWGMRILNSEDVYMFGGGLYSFFDSYEQTCLATEDCQLNMVDIQCSSKVFLYNLATKASTNQVLVDGQVAVAEVDNPNNFAATVLLYQQD